MRQPQDQYEPTSNISIRQSIRWLPDEESEPASAIVLLTPENRFVDLRILGPLPPLVVNWPMSGSCECFGHAQHIRHFMLISATLGRELPLSRLDWAIAGLSVTTTDNGTDGTEPASWFNIDRDNKTPGNWVQHNKWHHWIDSRTPNADEVVDEGDVFECPFSAELILERGRTLNPATGEMADYEEIWRSVVPEKPPMVNATQPQLDIECMALQWRGDYDGIGEQPKVKRGLVVRVGKYCQGFIRDGENIAVIREEWDDQAFLWKTEVKIGNMEMPILAATSCACGFWRGAKVNSDGRIWEVVEWVR